VPERRYSGPYEDYGWESGESTLPEFRGPEVRRMPWDRPRGRRRFESRMYGPRTRADYSPEELGYEAGYGVERYRRTEDWNVPGPYAGRGPKGYRRSNERIRDDVADRLTMHGQVDATEIEIQVEDGEVTLTGTVDSRRTKRLAEDLAESVTGVRDVHNQLRLQNRPADEGPNSPPQSGS
jgi:hypothetical protein